MGFLGRVAAAPISWGICEVPGWGLQLPPGRVLTEMRSLGIIATELGALGWLPDDPVVLRALLAEHGLTLTGGFVPLVLHDRAGRDDTMAAAHAAATTLAAGGATQFVTAVVSSTGSWERPLLGADEWAAMFEAFPIIDEVCQDHGLEQVVHPHVDTLIETSTEVARFLDHSPSKLCLDTGHVFIGGADPAALARAHHDRIGLVHIKDVDRQIADRLVAGELGLMEAAKEGVFPVAGTGDVPIAETVAVLEGAGYSGWYVLEQDTALMDGEPPAGAGPLLGVRRSIEYLGELDRQLKSSE